MAVAAVVIPHRPESPRVMPSPGTTHKGTLKQYGRWGSNKFGDKDNEIQNGALLLAPEEPEEEEKKEHHVDGDEILEGYKEEPSHWVKVKARSLPDRAYWYNKVRRYRPPTRPPQNANTTDTATIAATIVTATDRQHGRHRMPTPTADAAAAATAAAATIVTATATAFTTTTTTTIIIITTTATTTKVVGISKWKMHNKEATLTNAHEWAEFEREEDEDTAAPSTIEEVSNLTTLAGTVMVGSGCASDLVKNANYPTPCSCPCHRSTRRIPTRSGSSTYATTRLDSWHAWGASEQY